ncbi:hypothetical protein PENTCL1PPCAC_28898, partial [Pristionchus entomophagus]
MDALPSQFSLPSLPSSPPITDRHSRRRERSYSRRDIMIWLIQMNVYAVVYFFSFIFRCISDEDIVPFVSKLSLSYRIGYVYHVVHSTLLYRRMPPERNTSLQGDSNDSKTTPYNHVVHLQHPTVAAVGHGTKGSVWIKRKEDDFWINASGENNIEDSIFKAPYPEFTGGKKTIHYFRKFAFNPISRIPLSDDLPPWEQKTRDDLERSGVNSRSLDDAKLWLEEYNCCSKYYVRSLLHWWTAPDDKRRHHTPEAIARAEKEFYEFDRDEQRSSIEYCYEFLPTSFCVEWFAFVEELLAYKANSPSQPSLAEREALTDQQRRKLEPPKMPTIRRECQREPKKKVVDQGHRNFMKLLIRQNMHNQLITNPWSNVEEMCALNEARCEPEPEGKTPKEKMEHVHQKWVISRNIEVLQSLCGAPTLIGKCSTTMDKEGKIEYGKNERVVVPFWSEDGSLPPYYFAVTEERATLYDIMRSTAHFRLDLLPERWKGLVEVGLAQRIAADSAAFLRDLSIFVRSDAARKHVRLPMPFASLRPLDPLSSTPPPPNAIKNAVSRKVATAPASSFPAASLFLAVTPPIPIPAAAAPAIPSTSFSIPIIPQSPSSIPDCKPQGIAPFLFDSSTLPFSCPIPLDAIPSTSAASTLSVDQLQKLAVSFAASQNLSSSGVIASTPRTDLASRLPMTTTSSIDTTALQWMAFLQRAAVQKHPTELYHLMQELDRNRPAQRKRPAPKSGSIPHQPAVKRPHQEKSVIINNCTEKLLREHNVPVFEQNPFTGFQTPLIPRSILSDAALMRRVAEYSASEVRENFGFDRAAVLLAELNKS